MTPAQLSASARADAHPPTGLSPAARALWFTRRGDWAAAHAIAQDGQPARRPGEAETLWEEIAAVALR